jgi:FlaA1/EpsC-like NDP-sugar epimerase
VLLERSEPSLYTIHQELQGLLPAGVDLEPVLSSAADSALVERLFRQQRVMVVFHAAA